MRHIIYKGWEYVPAKADFPAHYHAVDTAKSKNRQKLILPVLGIEPTGEDSTLPAGSFSVGIYGVRHYYDRPLYVLFNRPDSSDRLLVLYSYDIGRRGGYWLEKSTGTVLFHTPPNVGYGVALAAILDLDQKITLSFWVKEGRYRDEYKIILINKNNQLKEERK